MRAFAAPIKHGCKHPVRNQRPFTSRSTRVRSAALATEQSLLSTIISKGALFPKAELSISIATDEPVLVTSADLNAGEALLSVPEGLWLTPERAQRSSIGALISGLEPWLQLALWILAEGDDATSPIYPYVSSLPATIDSPLFWSADELRALEGTQILESTNSYMTFFQSQYQQLQDELFASNPTAFPAEKFTFPGFMWAVATVRSRSHPPLEGADIALVPGADMVVHRVGCRNVLKVGRGGFLGRDRVLTLEAGRALRRGEAISLDFGRAGGKLDSLVLLDHGVLDPLSRPGGYQLTVAIPEDDRNIVDKLAILEAQGMGGGSASFTLSADREPDDTCMAFLRLMQLRKQDSFLLEGIFRDEVWGHMEFPVSEFNEGLVCEAMIRGAREALGGYPTSIEDDLALLKSGVQKGSRMEVALLVRLGEKEALDSVLRYFEDRQAGLRSLEYYADRRLKRLGLMDEKGRTTWDGMFKDSIA